jgi:hypothetical protein
MNVNATMKTVLAIAALSLGACSKSEDASEEAARKTTSDSKESKPSGTSSPATTVGGAKAGVVTQSEPASSPVIPKGSRSKVPTVAEFNAQTSEVKVAGAPELGCEAKVVREWLRVSCRKSHPSRGTAELAVVTRGDTNKHEHYTFSDEGIASLVLRFEPGVDLEAVFRFTAVTYKFNTAWPEGSPEPEIKGLFNGGAPIPSAPPGGEAQAGTPYGKELPGRSPIPTDLEYQRRGREVTVTNSTALQCETKKINEWLRVRCFGENGLRGKAVGVRVLQGASKNDVFSWMDGDAATLILPFVEDRNVVAEFEFSKTKRLFNSKWAAGDSEPARAGAF